MRKKTIYTILSLSPLIFNGSTFAQITNNPDDIFWSIGIGINLELYTSIGNLLEDSNVTFNDNTYINFHNDNGFFTGSFNNLKGNNVDIYLNTDIQGERGDRILIKENVFGSYKIHISNKGSSATTGRERLTIVEATNNQATWTLFNKVEVGAYEYNIRPTQENANNIELYSLNGGQTTTTAEAATSFLNIAYLTTYIENQTLLQRLGDLRNSEVVGVKNDGLWIKGFGGKLSSFSGNTVKGFDMTYTGTQLGIDKNIESDYGRFVVGVMAGLTRTNPNYREGNGTGKNYTAGLYATYLDDNGIYVDNVIKYNSMHNQFSVKDTAGSAVKGTGKTQGIMLSTEIGKRFWLNEHKQGFYLEPQTQLSYGYQNGDTVHANNGLKVGLSHYNSTLVRVSGIVGYQVQGENPVNVYLKTGGMREMSGGASYRFNHGEKKGHSFRSNWFDNGIGANVTINKQHNIYAEADYSTGNQFDNAMLNLGYRYSF